VASHDNDVALGVESTTRMKLGLTMRRRAAPGERIAMRMSSRAPGPSEVARRSQFYLKSARR